VDALGVRGKFRVAVVSKAALGAFGR